MGVIYVVRHGQADPKAYGIVGSEAASASGEVGGLTAMGIVQAGLTGDLLAAQIPSVTTAICGDLPRQRDTLAGVLGRFDNAPEPIVDPRWNEYALPALVGETSAAEFDDGRNYQKRLDDSLGAWVARNDKPDAAHDHSGETYGGFRDRVDAAGHDAAAHAGSGQTVVVVSSAGVIAQWIADLWGVPPQQWPTVARAMINASVTKLIVGRRGVSVVSFNEHAHLDDRDGGVATFR
ncbi:histidine phosphatase family protein [Gordonia sp. DT30]|uniref:histidine phosphatase family protein n=1 Tax=unclassified Gordonia (in: high G+C Gram-positive bacteria) TaxID=2657482 RepID=UPI003CF4E8F8